MDMEDNTVKQAPKAGAEENIGRHKRDGLQTRGGKEQGTQTENVKRKSDKMKRRRKNDEKKKLKLNS